MNHGLSPLYLSNLLPLHVGELSSYRLRNAENYVGIHASTSAYAESFLPLTLQAGNNLSEAVRSADTLAAFKHLLTLDAPKVPTYYDCGDRLNQISHTRLRTECSSLNQHILDATWYITLIVYVVKLKITNTSFCYVIVIIK